MHKYFAAFVVSVSGCSGALCIKGLALNLEGLLAVIISEMQGLLFELFGNWVENYAKVLNAVAHH